MAVWIKDGGNKRVWNFLIGLVLLGIGNAMVEDGSNVALGFIFMAAGPLGMLAAIFNPWVRKP